MPGPTSGSSAQYQPFRLFSPQGSFACGNEFCSIDSEHCLVISRGTLGSFARCEPLASACAGTPIDCDCLTKETLAKHAELDSCMECQDSGQGLTLPCYQP